ncbi:MAG: DUF374 domain-containing protein [Polyangiaceae bacterium]|nr:DUF374 domain-containing protein [Polyangiaceae bacterium]
MRERWRAAVGALLGLVARAWLATLRVRLELHPELERHRDAPWVLSFFHGTQWPLLAWKRRRPTVVLVSLSADGAMQARALATLKLHVVRGSSSRGGARGLAALVCRMKRDRMDAAFAVDGPRGPYGTVKRGALLAARHTGGWIVPLGSAATHAKIFARAWDRFVLAWPFTTVAVVLGAPIHAATANEHLVGEAIAHANARAAAMIRCARE